MDFSGSEFPEEPHLYPVALNAHCSPLAQTVLLCQADPCLVDMLHFTHATCPAGMKMPPRFSFSHPHHLLGSGVCTKFTRVWAFSLDTAIALESKASRVGTRHSGCP